MIERLTMNYKLRKEFGNMEVNLKKIRNYNKEYLGLNNIEIRFHEVLMVTKGSELPKDLIDYVNNNHKGDILNGDAIACWVADWIKTLREE